MQLNTKKKERTARMPTNQHLDLQLKWMVKLRWIAILCALVLASAARALGYRDISFMPVYGVLGISALGNMIVAWHVNRQQNRLVTLALLQIIFDQVTLGIVFYISGACFSPFLYFFLFHVVISGILLPYRYTAVIAGLAAAIPGVVVFLSHGGILPHTDIFNQNTGRFVDVTAFIIHGTSFLGTLVLTAYFVIYLNRQLYQSFRELQSSNQKLSTLVESSRPDLTLTEREQILSASFQTILNNSGLVARIVVPKDEQHGIRCYEFFACEQHTCPAYRIDATCWHLMGTLCTGGNARPQDGRNSRNTCGKIPPGSSRHSARTFEDKMSCCTSCEYLAQLVAAHDKNASLHQPHDQALSCQSDVPRDHVQAVLQAMRDGQQLLQEGRRSPRQVAVPRTDSLAFPLKMQDRLSGLLLLTSRSEMLCTGDTLAFIRLLSEVTSTGHFGTSLFEYLETSYLQIVMALANAVEAKDPYTRGHSDRVAFYSIQIAMALKLTKQEKEHLSFAAILHDIGKIGTNIDVLLKDDKLAARELEDIKGHPDIGARILAPVHFLKPVITAIRHHHENYDGSGYPSGLKGADIPLKARIVKIADTWDAMTSDRPYRKALSYSSALQELAKYTGTQFDPELVEVFKRTPAMEDGSSSLSGCNSAPYEA